MGKVGLQLSETVGWMALVSVAVQMPGSVLTTWLAGQATVGDSLSTIVTVKEQETVFNDGSVTV